MPDTTEKFALYFSHSWHSRDVDLNVLVWQEIAESCELLVDVPEEAGANPPYYINRIEELLRRSDLFLCVLTERDVAAGDGEGDEALMCSPYSLFEIRLAERFNIPRLVLYERRTRFKSPRSPRSSELYVAFDRGTNEGLPDRRTWRTSKAPKIRDWVNWAREHMKPAVVETPSLAVSLLPPHAPEAARVGGQLERALVDAGYEHVALRAAYRNNTQLFQILRSAGLVVTELGVDDPIGAQLNVVAHALGVPAIRTLRKEKNLPWLLQGHPGGYQHDIVRWNDLEELPALIQPRARAMFRISPALAGDEAHRYLESKRYARYFVFISHTLKPPGRSLVEHIYDMLAQHYLNPYEYHLVNDPGADWKKELSERIRETTHFIALLTDDFEQSPVCTYELEEILKRGAEVTILPFMAAGRTAPHPKLNHLHHTLLNGPNPKADAEEVAKKTMEVLKG